VPSPILVESFILSELYCGAVIGPALNGDRQVGFAQ
jgi:hypothetical protein